MREENKEEQQCSHGGKDNLAQKVGKTEFKYTRKGKTTKHRCNTFGRASDHTSGKIDRTWSHKQFETNFTKIQQETESLNIT